MFLRNVNFYEATRHSNPEENILRLLHWVLKLNGFSNLSTSNTWRMEASFLLLQELDNFSLFSLLHSAIFITIYAYKEVLRLLIFFFLSSYVYTFLMSP